jgi:glycosyltransferase involved in cell wall biosynthesis
MNEHEQSANRDQAISFRVRAQLLLATKTFNDLAGRYASRPENVGASAKEAVRLVSTQVPMLMKLRWAKDRWTLKHIWHRARLPVRRERWVRTRKGLANTYAKSPSAQFSAGRALVFGDFSGNTGVSRGAIYDFAELRQHHSEVMAIDISDYISGRRRPVHLVTEQVDTVYFFCQPDMYEHVLQLAAPEALKNSYRIGRWVWETPVFPKSWNFAQGLVHEVWTPSTFCADVFRRHLSLPVRVVPHAVMMPPGATVDMRTRLAVSNDAFLGLAVMDIRSCPDRKNPWAHIFAWQSAFGTNPNAVLLIKLRISKRTAVVQKELEDLIGANTNIKLMLDDLSDAEMASLQRSCDVFLSLHRSEGYGLNIHEALLCGKPTIATHWSANVEYGPAFPNYRGIKCSMVRYRDWTAHYDNGDFRWAEPDISHAASELKDVYAIAKGRKSATSPNRLREAV